MQIDKDAFSKVFNKDAKVNHAASKYHSLFCEGIAANGVPITSYSTLPINRNNCQHKYVSIKPKITGRYRREYITSFNIPGVRHVQLFLESFFKTLKSSKNTVVLYDPLAISASYGAVLGADISGKKKVAIVTDLPDFLSNNKTQNSINNKLLENPDGYVFLTKQMNDAVNKHHKPYIVLEGHSDIGMKDRQHRPIGKIRKIMYAGSLMKIYGIANLCEAFIECGFKDTELHIYGDGDYAPELQKMVKTHPNIVFHGSRENSEVVEAELESALLVNPRPTSGEYTKYSFPSKTMEYMASGTPVLSAKLPGIPDEYDEYLYYFDDKNKDGLKDALTVIMQKSDEELLRQGKAAKEFVIEKKNNKEQARKLIGFLRRI